MDKALIVKPEKCTGCNVCEFICSLQHDNHFNPMKSGIQAISWKM